MILFIYLCYSELSRGSKVLLDEFIGGLGFVFIVLVKLKERPYI